MDTVAVVVVTALHVVALAAMVLVAWDASKEVTEMRKLRKMRRG